MGGAGSGRPRHERRRPCSTATNSSRRCAQGIDTSTVVGVAADFCVRWAVDGLLERGFAVELPAALTRGIERQIDSVAAEDWVGASVRLV